jgi:hypothetical protein
MAARNVEVVDGVAEVVVVRGGACRRPEAEVELQAALRAVAEWLHPQLHDALGDGGAVTELGDVVDGQMHDF